jgi:hypothetical protein
MPYVIKAGSAFTPKDLPIRSRAMLIAKVNPTPCSCGAGDDAVLHGSNCAMVVAFDESMRTAERELRCQPHMDEEAKNGPR